MGHKAEESSGFAGDQLCVSLKLDNFERTGDLVPHIYGSVALLGCWNSSKALAMERDWSSMWRLNFVLPPNQETLEFKFILKPKHHDMPGVVEEGPGRLLSGSMRGTSRALFRLSNDEIVECLIFIKADRVSPFDLATSWMSYQEHLYPSSVRGIPDVSINSENDSVINLEFDLESYVIPPPPCSANSGLLYAANMTESPRTVSSSEGFPCSSISNGLVNSLQNGSSAEQSTTRQVGLPARGKTFTAAKLTRYLRWLGHDTKHFNVGKYRRLKHGVNQTADFFRADNLHGMEARNEVAALAMEDMIAWMQDGGQVGIFDATNSTKLRRNMLMKMAEGRCKIIFLESICNDRKIIDRNIRLKIQQSPDYAEQPDFNAGLQDFKMRLANYEKVYEPVEEGSYIKMIDMASGQGGQIQINNISGYLPGKIVFFLVNTHLTPRPIFLTRHGESRDNVWGRIGGDGKLSEAGEQYAKKLATFVGTRLKSERAASIWTSTLQRTILTASPIVGFPKSTTRSLKSLSKFCLNMLQIQWRALDEINAGVCDGMTYEEIRKNMPDEYISREMDKLRYRYPRGESYLDVIQRLEPVIIELERQRAPVVVISHQAVLRALYAYFADQPLDEIPHIEMPLHTIIEIQMGVSGVQEKRYKLTDQYHTR